MADGTHHGTAAPAAVIPDEAARAAIAGDLDRTLFVEAGAGAGKTTCLVQRLVNLVLSGIPLTAIAAITFTEKAAGELRHRLRSQLRAAHLAAESAGDGAAAARLAAAAGELDTAAIGTVHAFARRLLAEVAIEAGLPPRFDVLDEVQSAIAFDERFTDFVNELLDGTESTRLVQLCAFDNLRIERTLRQLAADFMQNWDLVEERVATTPPAPAAPALEPLLAEMESLVAADVPPGDSQEKTVAKVAAQLARLRAGGEPNEVLRVVAGLKKVGAKGDSAKWKRHHRSPEPLDRYRETGSRIEAMATDIIEAATVERKLLMGALLARFTLESVQQRRAAGELEFHDLLVFARQVLARNPGVRRTMHERYQRILLDEFQDTDPIQLELAVRITAVDPADERGGGERPDGERGEPTDWRTLRPEPGRLFVVGDPKQSIYRFRRADISQYLRAREQLGADGVTLQANFRTTSAVVDWINATMGGLIVAQPDVQAEFVPLVACRPGGAQAPDGTVTVLGAEAHADLGRSGAEELRAREAADVATAVTTALREGWPVGDGAGGRRACRADDITILLPSRLSLPALERALDVAGIPYRAENSSLVYAASEIRAIMLTLRAADDPTDELALVAALRTPLFGCSDRHLYEWKVERGNRFSLLGPVDETDDHPVASAIRFLQHLARRVPSTTPSQLISHIVDERRVLELALAGRGHRDVWRRVRFVIDQARTWSEAGGHGIRRYLAWTRLQGDEGRFVAETILPETDHDAVRIMTIHAAKGLEFPITMVSGLTTKGGGRSRGLRAVWTATGWTTAEQNDPDYQQFQPFDMSMSEAETARLLYVACTRAKDHLVVSLHRKEGALNTSAGRLAAVAPPELSQPIATAPPGSNDGGGVRQTPVPPMPAGDQDSHDVHTDQAEWERELASVLGRAAVRRVVSASTIAQQWAADDAGLRKDPVDLDLPPWQRGRYGTAVGRAVHGVLQFADLAGGTDIDRLAAAQAAAEGVDTMEATIAALARSALATGVVRSTRTNPHWRELFIATTVGGVVVEGYVDLLVRDPERGLVIADYKTDAPHSQADLDARISRYRHQLAVYGAALEDLLGEPVHGGCLVLCRADGPAQEHHLESWREAIDEVRHGVGRVAGVAGEPTSR